MIFNPAVGTRSPSNRLEPLKEGSGPERSKPAPGQVAAARRLDRPPQRSERAGRDRGALSLEEGNPESPRLATGPFRRAERARQVTGLQETQRAHPLDLDQTSFIASFPGQCRGAVEGLSSHRAIAKKDRGFGAAGEDQGTEPGIIHLHRVPDGVRGCHRRAGEIAFFPGDQGQIVVRLRGPMVIAQALIGQESFPIHPPGLVRFAEQVSRGSEIIGRPGGHEAIAQPVRDLPGRAEPGAGLGKLAALEGDGAEQVFTPHGTVVIPPGLESSEGRARFPVASFEISGPSRGGRHEEPHLGPGVF